jgi:transposase
MWPGNTADVKTLTPIVKRMRERFRLREITVVADRGTVSQATYNYASITFIVLVQLNFAVAPRIPWLSHI